MGSCIKIFIFRPYGFDYLGFLTNARRGAMRSKTQWVIYRDLDWWPGPQKVQFEEITGYPEVVGLILALLNVKSSGRLFQTCVAFSECPYWYFLYFLIVFFSIFCSLNYFFLGCDAKESIWICVTSGVLNCGRYVKAHGLAHYEKFGHSVCMDCHELSVFW